jgi:hypothetical protein
MTPRYKLRTLMILLAVLPPLIALAWWYWRVAVGMIVLAIFIDPGLPIVLFGYTFGALCHLAGGKSVDDSRPT